MTIDADEACFLVFQDTFYPGWKAYVDGLEQEILRTDIGFRAIRLDRGKHNVVMRYRPAPLRIGIFIACLGILAGTFYALRGRFKDGRNGRGPSPINSA